MTHPSHHTKAAFSQRNSESGLDKHDNRTAAIALLASGRGLHVERCVGGEVKRGTLLIRHALGDFLEYLNVLGRLFT